ncbi:MAG: Tat pathway signal protein, partial [Spirochaetaceae bacterium]
MNNTSDRPWYRRAYRWGQTNITEIDPSRYDSGLWREQWRRTRIHGVIVNAGGIVFYYPSNYPEVHRAEYLGERDLFGEIVDAAHEDGLVVLARMDSNRVHEPFFVEHPEWCSRDADGNPYRAGELYVTCVNSAYYTEFLPSVLREIAERYKPEGFTDNSYSGLNRNKICYCANCQKQFRDSSGHELPTRADWDSPVFKAWIRWNYDCRVRNWDINNAATRAAGGEHCHWVGMNSGDFVAQGVNFRDSKRIFERSEIVMADHQSRPMVPGFRQNGEAGKMMHGLLGWEKLIPESMAMYQHGHGQPVFRVASKPEPEVRLWAVEGFAGSIQPWWHHIGAFHEDRRQYRYAAPLLEWHEKNEDVLFDRTPVASIGVVWSQENTDFFGRDDAHVRVSLPFIGMTQALTRARFPYLPVHADQIAEYAERLTVLVLPNVGALSDAQCDAVRAFVADGGSIVASGEVGLYDEWGTRRADTPLADVIGVSPRGARHGAESFTVASFDSWHQHSYLRLTPEADAAQRHELLAGFDETDLLPFGGALHVVEPHVGTTVIATFVPPFPIYPPETSWMRIPRTNVPAIVARETEAGGRVVYLAADIDRTYARDNLPDHFR